MVYVKDLFYCQAMIFDIANAVCRSKGVISVVANIVPREIAELVASYERKYKPGTKPAL